MGAIIGAFYLCTTQPDCLNKESDDEYEKYNICDPDYDKLQLQNYRINNIDTYRYDRTGYFSSVELIKCPICKYRLSKEEEEVLQNYINSSNERKILKIKDNYHTLVKDVYEVDIFGDLGLKFHTIENLMEKIDESRYYKHVCNRSNFKEIIIDITSYEMGFNYRTLIYKPYSYETWGNNESIKNKLWKERQIAYDEQIRIDELNRIYEEKKKRKEEIENSYESDFDANCREKESYEISQVKRQLDDIVSEHKDVLSKEKEAFEQEKRDYDEGERKMREIDPDYVNEYIDWDAKWREREKALELDLTSIWENIDKYLKYYASKKDVQDYMYRYHSYNFDKYISREDWEIDEFHDYIRSQTSEYDRVRHYLNTHDYPLKNKYALVF